MGLPLGRTGAPAAASLAAARALPLLLVALVYAAAARAPVAGESSSVSTIPGGFQVPPVMMELHKPFSSSSSSIQASGHSSLPSETAVSLLDSLQTQDGRPVESGVPPFLPNHGNTAVNIASSYQGLLLTQSSGSQALQVMYPSVLDHPSTSPPLFSDSVPILGPAIAHGDQLKPTAENSISIMEDSSSTPASHLSPPSGTGILDLHGMNGTAHSSVAQGIHLLLNPPEMVAPSQVPLSRPHTDTAPDKKNLVPPEEFYPTNTMEANWGSGDYLESLSFMGSEDELSLVTSVVFNTYDFDASTTEAYDTSFPSRVVLPLSSRHISNSPTPAVAFGANLRTDELSLGHSSYAHPTSKPPVTSPNGVMKPPPDFDWTDPFSIEPTEILLPDMNSLEYYTTLLAKENISVAEQRNKQTSSKNVPHVSIRSSQVMPNSPFTVDLGHVSSSHNNSFFAEQSSTDISGSEPDSSSDDLTNDPVNGPEHLLEPSVVPTSYSVVWGSLASTTIQVDVVLPSMVRTTSSSPAVSVQQPSDTLSLPVWLSISPTSTGTPTLHPTTFIPTSMLAVSSEDMSPPAGPLSTKSVPSLTAMSDQSFIPEATRTETPVMVADEHLTTVSSRGTTATASNKTVTTRMYNLSTLSTTSIAPLTTTARTALSTPARQYLCNITRVDSYLVRVGFPVDSTVGYAKSHLREILRSEFNRSVELQVLKAPPNFIFRVVSGPVLYTAAAVINVLRQSARSSPVAQTASPVYAPPDLQYQVHSVLQFVPSHLDIRMCSFSERVEKGLTMAYAEVRRRSHEPGDFMIQIMNITMNTPKAQRQQRAPVDITFAVRDASGYLKGSEVSGHLRLLSMVEFSFYLGFPVLQIAEPFHYPELNVSHVLRSSWVKTVLLGVLDQRVNERTFQARMERRLALLLGEVLGTPRRWRRATSVGNNSVQIVRTSRLEGSDHPLEMVYFVEGPTGERLPAIAASGLLNRLDVQRAAIVLGYRVQGTLAQPVERVAAPPSETQNNNLWIIVGVVVPVVVVVIIIVILYWKLCRSDKLEFQPDAVSIQQRQKTPSVKGFDFAKLHLGQHSKDDIMVIQEPAPLPVPVKEMTPSENGDVPTPKSKASSTKAPAAAARCRGRISPSDGDSVGSDASSGRGSADESARPSATPIEGKHPRKCGKNANGAEDQQSSASIFEHVDRMPRPSDATRRSGNKIQLIAMQPMPAPSQESSSITERVVETTSINKEIQVALRHKSEIEHHRNKIRLRAKRKGHYDFPVMDDIVDGFESKDVYQKAQLQIDRILDPDAQMPSVFMEPRKSGRGRRSPKQRKKPPQSSDLVDADSDRLIPENDANYRKFPGVNNVAYVSDPDQPPELQTPSPTDDVFAPGSPPPGHAPPPPPYVPPQPSIEEARQQMHSLLDDAFALVSPTSQGSAPGVALPGVTPGASPPCRTPRGPTAGQWSCPYPSVLPLTPYSTRYTEPGVSPSAGQGPLHRQGLAPSYPPQGEQVRGEQIQSDALFSSRALYPEELPSSARPRPVGGTAGAQLHHLTQVGLSSQMGAYPAAGRASSSQAGASGWGRYCAEEDYGRPGPTRDQGLSFPEYSSSWALQMPRNSQREPSAPPAHLDPSGTGYPSAPPEETSPPNHTSASLIKAIREELMRLSQKQSATASYHS
ncbi:UPF0606 protein KIAA1549 isoform X2 [Scleropages formosus]|uniref:UPF0606 protein KIAA1549-like n=1 Tax=Scleropages formosus TaxID=113540 RepID=A0A8C9R6E7_SCLFO|nr:UPF0606 protein KIAA1549-like isoform X2 [Scleropages formosus]